jgi:CubicO group peptidase (beta-lactamase class C family)
MGLVARHHADEPSILSHKRHGRIAAGVLLVGAEIDKIPHEQFDEHIRCNVRTAFLMTKYAVPHLRETKGNIICAGSAAGINGEPAATVYGGTKGFLNAFTAGVAVEQAKYGIRVADRYRMDPQRNRSGQRDDREGAGYVVPFDIVYRRAAGFADREADRAMQEDDIFLLASIAKPIVTAAALRLVENGSIRVGDPAHRWLPEFRPQLADGRVPEITIHHLLTHSAGLTYVFIEPDDGPYHRLRVSSGFDRTDITNLDDFVRRISAAPLTYEPGSGWGYSNAIDVLGAVIEKATGQPLPQAVAELVLNPLDIKETAFAVVDPRRLVAQYADGRPEPRRMADDDSADFFGRPVAFLSRPAARANSISIRRIRHRRDGEGCPDILGSRAVRRAAAIADTACDVHRTSPNARPSGRTGLGVWLWRCRACRAQSGGYAAGAGDAAMEWGPPGTNGSSTLPTSSPS